MFVAKKLRTLREGVHSLNIETKPQKEFCSFCICTACSMGIKSGSTAATL